MELLLSLCMPQQHGSRELGRSSSGHGTCCCSGMLPCILSSSRTSPAAVFAMSDRARIEKGSSMLTPILSMPARQEGQVVQMS